MFTETIRFAHRKISRRGARGAIGLRPIVAMWAPNCRAATRGRPYSAILMMLMIVALSLSACGKSGPPEPPNPQTDKFPRQYPDPSSL